MSWSSGTRPKIPGPTPSINRAKKVVKNVKKMLTKKSVKNYSDGTSEVSSGVIGNSMTA